MLAVVQMMPGPIQSLPFALYLVARAFALVGFVLMFYQFIITARLPFMEAIFKRPNMIKTHRTLGKIGLILVLVHGIILFSMDPTFYFEKNLGIIGLALLTVAVIAAWFFKPLKLKLKTWRAIHLAAYLVFPLGFAHALLLGSTVNSARPVYWLFAVLFAVYCLVVVNRLMRAFGAKTPRARA
jgi:DMSO/TMAO reductase YedYZ heme-binding membrane subunit